MEKMRETHAKRHNETIRALKNAHEVMAKKHQASLQEFSSVRKQFEDETDNLRQLHAAKISSLEAQHEIRCKEIAEFYRKRAEEQALAHENAIQLQAQLHETAMMGKPDHHSSNSHSDPEIQFQLASAQTEARHFQDECESMKAQIITLKGDLSRQSARAEQDHKLIIDKHKQECTELEMHHLNTLKLAKEAATSVQTDLDTQLATANSLLNSEREAHARTMREVSSLLPLYSSLPPFLPPSLSLSIYIYIYICFC